MTCQYVNHVFLRAHSTELLTSVSHPTLISNNFSLQPGSDGQVLAALSILNGFLLFDLRRSRTGMHESFLRSFISILMSSFSYRASNEPNSLASDLTTVHHVFTSG